MSLTVQNYVARVTEKKAQDLLAAAVAVPEHKHSWQPQEKGRTVIDQIAECAVINRMAIKMLQGRAWDTAGREQRQRDRAALDTLEKARASLRENTSALVEAIRAVPDDELELELELPWAMSTVADALLIPYWNMCYHEGQISYIHTLIE